jgi:uncharacterized protein (TIGR03437 family)
VLFSVTAPTPPELGVDATGFSFTFAVDGEPRSEAFLVLNRGSGHIYKFIPGAAALLADAANPAAAGDVVIIYCSGLGRVDPPVEAGQAAPLNPLSRTVLPVTLRIGGVTADVSFAGLAPDFSGLYQINATVPAGVAAGNEVTVDLDVAQQRSPQVTMAIR